MSASVSVGHCCQPVEHSNELMVVRPNRVEVLDIYRIVRLPLDNRSCCLVRDSKFTNMVGKKGGNGSVETDSVVKKVALVISTVSLIRVSPPSLDLLHHENEFKITAGLVISSISHKLVAT